MLIEVNESDLSIIKSVGVDILLEVKRICNNHNIKYSIYAGTLLGAVRHGGYIPWDNDVDVAMLRDEYDKFLQYAELELKDTFQLVNYNTEKHYGEPFTKIMAKGTVMKEAFTGNSQAPSGVFVDIFPIDNVPENKWNQGIHRFKNYILRKKILIRCHYDFNKTGIKKMIYKIIELSTIASKNKLVDLYNRNAVKYRNTKTEYVTILGGNYGYYGEMLPRNIFDEYVEMKFEGETFSAIKQYDFMLTHNYGDYMKLPPVEQRGKKHQVEKLDLTTYGGSRVGFD